MKTLSAPIVASLAWAVISSPIAGSEEYKVAIYSRNPGGINYEQKYNGKVADFSVNESMGAYACKWDGSTDFCSWPRLVHWSCPVSISVNIMSPSH